MYGVKREQHSSDLAWESLQIGHYSTSCRGLCRCRQVLCLLVVSLVVYALGHRRDVVSRSVVVES